ncbi:hypothetical protein ACJBXD_10965, partial [Streptococcus suis]
FNPAIGRIFKNLTETGAGGGAADIDVEITGKSWCFDILAGFTALQQQAAALHRIRCYIGWLFSTGGSYVEKLKNNGQDWQ